ncbi:ABC transporter ATP-binding protein [Halobacillus fulvus]|nr:ABC transporter ATP-binding protein [Halobacillus fulvus]
MIEVRELTKVYEKEKAVDHLSFTLPEKRCVALLGPNGAGKTTTLKMIAGLITPSSGQVIIEGSHKQDIRPYIGYLPQHPHFYNWMSGKEFLIYVGQLAHLTKKEAKQRADVLLERVGIADAKNRRIGKYSGGMKQRLGIAQAMIHQPKVLMLDEPVSALDPIGRRDVLNLMNELKKETTILYSTHILSDAEEMSDEILLLHKGKAVESGSLEDVKQRHQVQKISLKFSHDLAVYQKRLESLAFVTKSEVEKHVLSLYVTNIQEAREFLLAKASKEKWPLTQFEIGQITLEDLFLKVVNTNAVADHIS